MGVPHSQLDKGMDRGRLGMWCRSVRNLGAQHVIACAIIAKCGEIASNSILPELVSGRGTATRSGVVEGCGAASAAARQPLRQRSALPPPRDKLGEELEGEVRA